MDSKTAAERIYMLREQIKAMETEVDSLTKEHFATRAEDTYAEGPFRVNVMRNARFDPALARKVLSPEEYESILETVTAPSSKKAKDVLAPAVYRTLQKDATYKKVSITLPEED